VVSEAKRPAKETAREEIRFTEAQIVTILNEYEASGKTTEVCRRHGIHANTLRNWKVKYGGLEFSDVVRMKQLEEENARLKRIAGGSEVAVTRPNEPWSMDFVHDGLGASA
jgi:putative transposase